MERKKDIDRQQATAGYPVEVNHPLFNKISPFGENHACAYAYKRTERMSMALYLVTNLVPESEPARAAARDKSLRLLSDILALRAGFRSTGSTQVNGVIAVIHEIISLLGIVHAAGYISDMNLEVLRREYTNLIVFLREAEDNERAEGVAFPDAYFSAAPLPDLKGHSKGQMSFNKKTSENNSIPKQTHQRQGLKRTEVEVRHTSRREEIGKIIKDKNAVTIKDITEVITDCSEKTIQRELTALVADGVLKKVGERRWSMYSLAS